MGNRHGRVRVHRRNVSLLRCAAGHRSALAGGRLHLWLPAASGSIAGGVDEVAGKDFGAACVQRPAAAIGRKTRGSASMITSSANRNLRASVSLASCHGAGRGGGG